METLAKASYSTIEICDMANVTYRMLDHWLRQGVLPMECTANGQGHPRVFDREETSLIIKLGHIYNILKNIGVDPRLEFLREAADKLERNQPLIFGSQVIIMFDGSEVPIAA
jgi:hypothetical protein